MLIEGIIAGTVAVSALCAWDRPGVDRFVGDPVRAVDHYRDIPVEVRQRLKARLTAHRYDDLVEIRRDSVAGQHRYTAALRDMHFGTNRLCREVTRTGWSATRVERGMVYCDSGHCLIVPTVCGNLSRTTRLDDDGQMAAAAGTDEPLQFDPPGAGPSFDQLAAPGAAVGGISASADGADALAPPDHASAGPTLSGGQSDPAGPAGGGPVTRPGAGSGWGGEIDDPFGGGPLPWRPGQIVGPGPVAPVPEVGTLFMWAAGLALLVARRGRRACGARHARAD